MKVQVKRAFKRNFFVSKRVTKKQTGSAWNFLQPPIPVCRGACILYFKINAPIKCCPLFSGNYLNPQDSINKIVNKHTVDYHPSPSKLTLRTHPLIFLWTPKEFISPEYFLNFFLNLYIRPWLRKSFKYMVLRLLASTFVSEKIEFVHFYSCPEAKLSPRFLSLLRRQKEITHSSQTVFSEDLFFPQQKGGEGLWS